MEADRGGKDVDQWFFMPIVCFRSCATSQQFYKSRLGPLTLQRVVGLTQHEVNILMFVGNIRTMQQEPQTNV